MKFKEFQVEVQRTLPNLHEMYYEDKSSDVRMGMMVFIQQSKSPEGEETTKHIQAPDLLNILHMRLGIAGEIDELMEAIHKGDKVNIGEELGDQLWYVANDLTIGLRQGLIDISDYTTLSNYEFGKSIQATDGAYLVIAQGVNGWLNGIIYNSCKLIDFAKKQLAYGRPQDPREYTKTIKYLIGAINNLAYELHIDLDDYMAKIIAKLRARYKDKFTASEANNRNLEKERSILEESVVGAKGIEDKGAEGLPSVDGSKEPNKENAFIGTVEGVQGHPDPEGLPSQEQTLQSSQPQEQPVQLSQPTEEQSSSSAASLQP